LEFKMQVEDGSVVITDDLRSVSIDLLSNNLVQK